MVDSATFRLIHKELERCRLTHGLNAVEKCRDLAVEYLRFISRFNGVDYGY